ncbi:MAG: hypothetical protein KIT31_08940 [Deltaproteobacteria bacterium]|nr:hypothetical protein [Deltaproteobacteria bacterium]
MNHFKYGVLVCGVLGIIGFFLPALADVPDSSLWGARSSADAKQIWLVLACFLGAAAMGGLGVMKGMARWRAFAAIVCFVYVVVKFRAGLSGSGTPFELFSQGLGAQLIAAGALGGLACAIVASLRPEDDAATA